MNIKEHERTSLADWKGIIFVTDPTWGDNGKGKVVDFLATRADMVVRTNGGPNAGHTVVNNYGEFKLHHLPCGIFNPAALCVIADTVVIDPFTLVEEIDSLKNAGIELDSDRLLISENSHLIMPWHKIRDNLREVARGGGKIGTTGRGIGPVFADRSERMGLQIHDLIQPGLEKKLRHEIDFQKDLINLMNYGAKVKLPEINFVELLGKLEKITDRLAPLIDNSIKLIFEYTQLDRHILAEAGQGMLLDLDRGTYPFVTSSHPGIAGFNLATGLNPRRVNKTIAVTKAYTTRVGTGPMPTELIDETGERIRKIGREFGTTTGRPRRVGWLDIPAIRYGAEAAGANSIALTKLDIFDDFYTIKICTGYEVDRQIFDRAPSALPDFLEKIEPDYLSLPGWEENISDVRNYDDLPENARYFIEEVEERIGLPIELISVGPAREQTIYR